MSPSVAIDTTPMGCYHFADITGMTEPLVDLHEMVEEGDPLMRIWPTTVTRYPPLTVHASRGGLISGRHFPAS